MRVRSLISTIALLVFLAAAFLALHASATARELSAPLNHAVHAKDASGLAPQSETSATKTVILPILVYHIVRPSRASDSPAVRAMALTPETFDAQLAHLNISGYHVVGFRDLEKYFSSGTSLPAKPVIISFDDGWADQYKYAVPILEKYHDTATFFVYTNAIDHRGFLSWQDLNNLIANGMTIGDHSRSHPHLANIANSQRLWDEIYGSKNTLEKKLLVSITEFAYPFGQHNHATIEVVRKAGFLVARGDVWRGNAQSANRLYELSARNAPTTIPEFERDFP
jgi:peptidoglycan/xylan/chitin deacetylase (PgdA/CDA1 family)